jgi:hypothetical protein
MTHENEIPTLPPIDAESILAMIHRLRSSIPMKSYLPAPEDGRLHVPVGSTIEFEYRVVLQELHAFTNDLGSAIVRVEEFAQEEALRCI